jgi:CheY-like chemotaxis protein
MRNSSEFSLFGTLGIGAKHREPSEPAATVTADLPAAAATSATETRQAGQEMSATTSAVSVAEPLMVEQLSMAQIEELVHSENPETQEAVACPATPAEVVTGAKESARKERRGKRRALISAPVRVRSVDSTGNALDDVTTTVNASRLGILLTTSNPIYYRSMDVMVTFPHSKSPDAMQTEQPGRVVRISALKDGHRSIAIALGVTHAGDEFVLSNGTTVQAQAETPAIKVERDPNSRRPLVLALDAEANVRESLKSYLGNEGYDVIAVTNAQEARKVLDQCTPALLIAEIEGDGMPGYDICVHCKSTPRLQSVPVMLTTSSAYPSDYASAHSLGAVVCMAKPYRQERLGNVVKLLAPPPKANENCQPPRPADPSRRHLCSNKTTPPAAPSITRRLLFGKK